MPRKKEQYTVEIVLVDFDKDGKRIETPWETLTEAEQEAFKEMNTDRFMRAMGYVPEPV